MCRGNRRGKPAAIEATLHHNDAVDLEHRHPQAVAGSMLRGGIDVDDHRIWGIQGQHVLHPLTQMATATGEEHDFHAYSTIEKRLSGIHPRFVL